MRDRGGLPEAPVPLWPVPGLFGRHEARAWALIGLALVASAALVQLLVAGPGLLAPCDDLPAGAPDRRCDATDWSHPAEGTVALAFVVQHGILLAGAALATFGIFTLRMAPGLWGIWVAYVGFLPMPVDAALRGWSSAAAQDLGSFTAIWGYLGLGAWGWALRGRFTDKSRAFVFGLLAFLFVGGVGALWVSSTNFRDVGWNLFAFAFALVQLSAGAWLAAAVATSPEEALAPPMGRPERAPVAIEDR